MANENKIFTGTDGALWLNNTDKLLRVSAFSFKQTNKFEDIDDTDSFATQKRLVGVELTGEITQYKTTFNFNEIMAEYADKKQPVLSLVGKISNPDTGEEKRVSITDVTLGEMDLMAFEKGKATQDKITFSAGGYQYI